ncbi:MAG: FtsX-like permease family protein [Bacteroidota bacterium]
MSFNLDQAVAAWRKKVLQAKAMEPGFLEELESNLLDRYDEYLIKGLEPAEAFAKAEAKSTPELPVLATEYEKAFDPNYQAHQLRNGFLWLLPNYLKVALRNLARKRFYNIINYVCLAVGILATTLAVLYLNYETSFDKMVPDADRKYRVGQQYRSQGYSLVGFVNYNGTTPEGQLNHINAIGNIQGVEQACQFFVFPEPTRIRVGVNNFNTTDILKTNTPEAFFDFFGWPIEEGTLDNFSNKINTALLTESEAERLFGLQWRTKNIQDQALVIGETTYDIVGILADIPPNTHYDFSIALHQPSLDYWGGRTYVKLNEGAEPEVVAQQMKANMVTINTRLAESELFSGLLLQPITSIHLNSDLLYEMKPPGDKRYLYIIGIISAIILLLTISNYTNLSIAMNSSRTREIGMRKIFGARKRQVAWQFNLESIVLALLTLPVVALGLRALIPWFNQFMGTEIEAAILSSFTFWSIIFVITLGVGLLASLYSAFFLAKYPILKLFHGDFASKMVEGFSTRKAIISFQFILLIGLCSLTLFVNQQLQYMQNKDLGYNTDQIVYVALTADSARYATFKNEILQIPEVTQVGMGSTMGSSSYNQTTYQLSGTSEVFDDAYNIAFDYDAIELHGLETSIEDYVQNPASAPEEIVLINQTFADKLSRQFGIQQNDLIGQILIQEPEYTDEETGEVGFPYQIGGFFDDINMFSLREKVGPMFLSVTNNPRYVYWVSVAWKDATPAAIIEKIKVKYEGLQLRQAFNYEFLDQNLEALYLNEQRIARLCIYFSLIAFAVAVIGLIALTAYLTALKKKEIGIRQILGASDADILRRFNSEYLLLLLISLMIAIPLTWYGVSGWLSNFAYRIDLKVWVFLLAGFITLLITTVSVSLMAWKTMREVPINALQETQ